MGQMVLGGVEGAVEQGCKQFLVRLEYTQKLGRIVINARNTIRIQCNLCNFREVMRRVTVIVGCVSVKLILLTATLPLEMEQELQLICWM
jgi:hypothetical protein